MKTEQQETNRRIVQQWKRAAPELERVRQEELRAYVYDPCAVDAMLEFGLRHAQPREGCGLVEMQQYFMQAARRKGLLPDAEAVYPEIPEEGLRVAEHAQRESTCMGHKEHITNKELNTTHLSLRVFCSLRQNERFYPSGFGRHNEASDDANG